MKRFRTQTRMHAPQSLCMHLSYSLDSMETTFITQAACFLSIRTRSIFSSVCIAATFLTRINLRTRPQAMAKSTTIRRMSHSRIVIFFLSNLCIQDENGVFKHSCSPVGLPLGGYLHKVQARVPSRRWRWGRCLHSLWDSPRRFLDRWYLTYQRSSWCS